MTNEERATSEFPQQVATHCHVCRSEMARHLIEVRHSPARTWIERLLPDRKHQLVELGYFCKQQTCPQFGIVTLHCKSTPQTPTQGEKK